MPDDAPDLPLDDPAFYRWWTEVPVRFSDTDLIGHVNNVGHTAIVESARIPYITDILKPLASPGTVVNPVMFVRLEIDFRADLYWPCTARVGARCISIGQSSFRIGIGVFDGDRCATTSINVMVNMGEEGRPEPLSDQARALLAAERPE